MIEIAIDPILRLGSLEVRWITITTILSFSIVIVMGTAELKRAYPIQPRHIIGINLFFLVGALLGGRLSAIVYNWQYLSTYPDQILLSLTIKIYGVLIGALVAVFIHEKLFHSKLPFCGVADSAAPAAMLGMAFYRIGCIIDGCCYGIHTDVSWAVVYTHPDSHAPFGKLLHPTQAYHLFLGLIVFAIIWFLRRRLKPQGSLFLLWLALFAITDLPVRFFREEETLPLGINLAVVIDTLILLITVPWLIIRLRSASTRGNSAHM